MWGFNTRKSIIEERCFFARGRYVWIFLHSSGDVSTKFFINLFIINEKFAKQGHFNHEQWDMYGTDGRLGLKPNAIPTIFIPNPPKYVPIEKSKGSNIYNI